MRVTANNNGSAIRVAPGASLDEHLFVAIDGDLDGSLSTNLNVPVSAGATNTNDYLYYYLPNRLGSVMGLLDATDDRYMLEYYRYTVYGEATVLPLYDTGLNQIEDTPTDLSDNNSAMLATRTGGGDATAGRASTFNNQYTFTGRYLDADTGLHYFRFRYYESRTGRFISRDPAESPWTNTYSYCENCTSYYTDPMGLQADNAKSTSRTECEEECYRNYRKEIDSYNAIEWEDDPISGRTGAQRKENLVGISNRAWQHCVDECMRKYPTASEYKAEVTDWAKSQMEDLKDALEEAKKAKDISEWSKSYGKSKVRERLSEWAKKKFEEKGGIDPTGKLAPCTTLAMMYLADILSQGKEPNETTCGEARDKLKKDNPVGYAALAAACKLAAPEADWTMCKEWGSWAMRKP